MRRVCHPMQRDPHSLALSLCPPHSTEEVNTPIERCGHLGPDWLTSKGGGCNSAFGAGGMGGGNTHKHAHTRTCTRSEKMRAQGVSAYLLVTNMRRTMARGGRRKRMPHARMRRRLTLAPKSARPQAGRWGHRRSRCMTTTVAQAWVPSRCGSCRRCCQTKSINTPSFNTKCNGGTQALAALTPIRWPQSVRCETRSATLRKASGGT